MCSVEAAVNHVSRALDNVLRRVGPESIGQVLTKVGQTINKYKKQNNRGIPIKYSKLSHKPETKLKISASLKGKKKTEETKTRMREARYRYLASLETKLTGN